MLRSFGLTQDSYEALLVAQSGLCAICHSNMPLSVDHDHLTGAVRGLLCATCNFMIGHGKDSPSLLRSAADYLERTR